MAKNSLSLEALKAHLFETLEGVKNNNDPEADPCEKVSLEQAKSIVNIADSIIEIYKTQVDAVRVFTGIDHVNSQGQLMVGMGIINEEEQKVIGN